MLLGQNLNGRWMPLFVKKILEKTMRGGFWNSEGARVRGKLNRRNAAYGKF